MRDELPRTTRVWLRRALPVVLTVVVWTLVAIGATYLAVGLLLVWLAHSMRPHLGWVGGVITLLLALAGWTTVIPAALIIAAGYGLHRLRSA